MWLLGTWTKGWCPNFHFAPGLLVDELKVIRDWAGARASRRGMLCWFSVEYLALVGFIFSCATVVGLARWWMVDLLLFWDCLVLDCFLLVLDPLLLKVGVSNFFLVSPFGLPFCSSPVYGLSIFFFHKKNRWWKLNISIHYFETNKNEFKEHIKGYDWDQTNSCCHKCYHQEMHYQTN